MVKSILPPVHRFFLVLIGTILIVDCQVSAAADESTSNSRPPISAGSEIAYPPFCGVDAAGRARSFFSGEYAYAVPAGKSSLLAHFSEGLKLLEETGAYRSIYEKWLGVYPETRPTLITAMRYSALVIGPLFLILLAVVLWSWILRKQVANRTKALQESEEFQRALITCSPVALFSTDLDGKVMVWNASAEKVFGWTAEELSGRQLPIIPEDRREEFTMLRRHLLEGNGVSGIEVVRQRKDGRLFDARLSAAPIRAVQGKIIGIMSSIEDITDRRQNEVIQQRLRARLSQAVEMARLGYWEYDVAADLFFFDDAFYNIFCTTAEQVGGYSMSPKDYADRFVHPDDRSIVAEETRKALETTDPGYHSQFEHRIRYADGTTGFISVRFFIAKDDHGRTVKTYGVNQDITQRKKAQRALEENRRRLSILLSNLPGMVYRCKNDPDWTMEFVSDGCLPLTGYTPEALTGNAVLSYAADIIQSEDCRKVWEQVQAALKEKRPYELVYRIVTADKKEKWVWEQGQGIFEPEENLVALEGFITDITDFKQAESDRERLQAQLIQAQKMESVGRLAGGVAHDFNNMLNVIIGYAELAMETTSADDPVQNNLKEILQAARRSADITRQLLAFARRQTIRPEVLDLNETVEGMLKMLRRLIGEDIDLSWRPGAGLGPVRMDPSQIDQILANLFVNARDAIDGVGIITVETDSVRLDETYCANHAGFVPGDFVLLAVSDDGCGMDKATLENLFEPFFTTKDVGEGTGLGLAMVYGIIKQNDGFINVYSEPGKGTTFKIYLPCHAGEADRVAPLGGADLPAGRGETVLIVEDEEPILKLTKTILERLGYLVIEAATPHRALEIVAAHAGEIHLLITDVVMPEMNGRDLVDQLYSMDPDLKILFMSGYTAKVIAQRGGLAAGLNYLQKPFSNRDLAIKVREALAA